MKFVDSIAIQGAKRRADGYLVYDARVARTGVQLYAGKEVGRPDLPTVRVYRPGSEVFSQDTMASFAHRPITVEHPKEAVTADNWRKYAVGQTADEIVGESKFLRVPLMVADAAAIKSIEDGKRELSAGYDCELDWTPGQTADGESYDAVQRKIRANHVAIVDRGRAGHDCRIGDDSAEFWGVAPQVNARSESMVDIKTRTVVIDGLSIETTDQGAQAIDKLQKQLSDQAAEHAKAITAKDAALADAKKEKDEADGKIKALEKQVSDAAVTPEKLNAMVKDRSAILSAARQHLGDQAIDDKTDAEIRKLVVSKSLGDEVVATMSDDAIRGAFTALAKSNAGGGGDQIRDALTNGVHSVGDGAWPTSLYDRAGVRMKQANGKA